MKALEFVQKLESAAPSIEVLESAGLSEEQARDFRSSFIATKRSSIAPCIDELGELGCLYESFDVSQLVVGMFRFLDRPNEAPSSWLVGFVEADYVVADKTSRRLYVVDSSSPEHVIWMVASNGDAFLEALAEAAEYLAKTAVDEQFWNDPKEAAACVNRSVAAAGGEEFRSFYEMLIAS